jgi:hypothetical protein
LWGSENLAIHWSSIFLDDLSQALNEALNLPRGALLYALAADGLTRFHINPKLDFVDPRKLASTTPLGGGRATLWAPVWGCG